MVLLDAALAKTGDGLDLEDIRRCLEAVEDVQVMTVSGLGGHPEVVSASDYCGVQRLVLGLGEGEYQRSAWQAQARRVGIDPLGIEVLNLGTHAALAFSKTDGTARAHLLLAAAVSAASVFPGSVPENSKPCMPAQLSRRSIFTFALIEYRAVPWVREGLCRASEGCTLCVGACPWQALEVDGEWRLEKSRCRSCGLCVSACPRDAISLPGYTHQQLAARLGTLLDKEVGEIWPRGIVFLCQRLASSLKGLTHKGSGYPAEWLPVEVPCLGMVNPAWFFWGLSRGAAAVAAVCSDYPCPFGREEAVRGKVAYARELLARLGGLEDAITGLATADGSAFKGELRFLPVEKRRSEVPRTVRQDLVSFRSLPAPDFTTKAAAEVFLGAARELRKSPRSTVSFGVSVAHPHSPFGVVRVEREGCTACGLCARVCPSGALMLDRKNDHLDLTFNHALCVACGACLPVCRGSGEGVLTLARMTDMELLARERVLLYRSPGLRCEICGTPTASKALVARLTTLLEGHGTRATDSIGRYCPSCRVIKSIAQG
ncbi:MAG: 4Fe-4S binding protein [Firmicutes bacterium]|nr:4Fe-4S binding protein [Bacillota bacterium]